MTLDKKENIGYQEALVNYSKWKWHYEERVDPASSLLKLSLGHKDGVDPT